MYQTSRLTGDRGALTNTDRLDGLAMACQYWVDAIAQDVEQRMGVGNEELMAAELNRLREQASLGFALSRVTRVTRPAPPLIFDGRQLNFS